MRKKNLAFAVCINNAGYPASLELRKIYRILPASETEAAHHLRVIDESGEDYLYPSARFLLVALPQTVRRALLKAS